MRKFANQSSADPNLSIKRRHAINKRKRACFIIFIIIALSFLSTLKMFWPINDFKPLSQGMGLPNEIAVDDDNFEPKKATLLNMETENEEEEEGESNNEGETSNEEESNNENENQINSNSNQSNQTFASMNDGNAETDFPEKNVSKTETISAGNFSETSTNPVKSSNILSVVKRPIKRSIINVSESDECKIPRPLQTCRLNSGERIHIVFVSAMWYREPFTQVETENIIKSILFQTSCPLFLHFLIAGEPEIHSIPKMMAKINAQYILSLPSPFLEPSNSPLPLTPVKNPSQNDGYFNYTAENTHPVLYSMHTIPTTWVAKRAKSLFLYPLAHHAGIPGMAKFFMADILHQVNRALYLDVDMLFAGDVQDMWQYFQTFDVAGGEELLYYMSNNHPEGHNKRRLLRPYCSCQMVLDLNRMRKANLTNILVQILNGSKPKSLKEYVEDGDQWLFMWICKQLGKVCRILPRMWNVSGCSKPVPFLGLNARGKEANGMCWRIVHFNCMGHVRGRAGAYTMPNEWMEASKWVKKLRLEKWRGVV